MTRNKNNPIILTLKDRCRVCYTCVRECPAKAIRIIDGQAEIVPERCIGCGNCVKVCSQKAKKVLSSIEEVSAMLDGQTKTVALIAPSFPAEFAEIDHRQLVGQLRALGFDWVVEVGFGADLVAREMRRLLTETDNRYISTACPAVFGYIKRYQPDLIPLMAPVVSPMIAMARVMKRLHGEDIQTVFIGPCISKMGEAYSDEMAGEVDEVLTFGELRHMLADHRITADKVAPSDFDPPHAGAGNLFPIMRGLLQAAEIEEDLITGEVVSASGKGQFIDAITEFGSGTLDARLLDVLCCDGCIMGAGMTTSAPLYKRRARISRHVRRVAPVRDKGQWRRYMGQFRDMDLSRDFIAFDQRLSHPQDETIKDILAHMGKFSPADELNCGACGYETCREHAIAIHKGLAESEMCLPHTIEQLHLTIQELNDSHHELADTRAALIQSEKLGSMGQLAAGIAHEVNNPLGVVLMYAHLLKDELDGHPDLFEDIEMIVDHADRAKKIVSGLLQFARQNKVVRQTIDLHKLVGDFFKVQPAPDEVSVRVENAMANTKASLDRDQILQVLTNLVSNAIAAMEQKGMLTIRLSDTPDTVTLRVSDTGAGIPKAMQSKIFEPFFTTKSMGEGTGLGLAIIYGIVKMHRGDIRVESNHDPAAGPTGTTFTVTLPREGQDAPQGA